MFKTKTFLNKDKNNPIKSPNNPQRASVYAKLKNFQENLNNDKN